MNRSTNEKGFLGRLVSVVNRSTAEGSIQRTSDVDWFARRSMRTQRPGGTARRRGLAATLTQR
jgi:hypothetical protein